MPKSTEKPGKSPPVTSHPLFPSIVALWFGALFGLGSLAIRPSLLEAAVISSRIDLLIPAAAPPLGVTSRLLLAVVLAAIGGFLGAWLGRRIARPKPTVLARRRGAGGSPAQTGVAHVAAGGGNLAGRRRSLAMDEDQGPGYDRELAPLPGQTPQILDVTEVDFGEEIVAASEPVELDLTGFAQPTEAPQPYEGTSQMDSQFIPVDAPLGDAPEPAFAPPAETRPFDAEPVTQASPFAQPAASAPNFAAPAETRPFDPAPEAQAAAFAPPAAPAPSFAPPPEARPFDASPAAQATPFAPPVAEPFAPSPAFAAPPVVERAVEHRPFDAAPFAQPANFAPSQPVCEAREEAVAHDAPQEAAAPIETAPVGIAQPVETAAERIVGEDLGELSHVELAERLAMTMQRRRKQPTSIEAVARTIATASAPIAPEPIIVQDAAPISFPAPGPSFGVSSAEAADARQAVEPAPAAPALGESGQRAPLELPAAMRPLDLTAFAAEDEDDEAAAFAPPRYIPMPPVPAPVAAAEPPALPAEATEVEAEIESEDDILAQGYSSLLDLSRPPAERQPFVRIEEPQPETGEIEPVVIFPGQALRQTARFDAPVAVPEAQPEAASAAEPASPVRRFDAPPSGLVAGEAGPAPVLPLRDAAETERALRTALASLQRMSGAA